ncbi:uncharacterized protein LOC128875093 [Hylaeus volcanicus]|uniref:uncharacterized protein LOC128875093 n=1 Tax=Hylaeus volcanicus TaxID=313075 RepID=UPI0023B87F6D|nr:uncharacterized protein LOC128875093 [Hylaeus volcanicus]
MRAYRKGEELTQPMRGNREEGDGPTSAPEEMHSAPPSQEKGKTRRKSLEQANENEYSDESRNVRKKLKIIGSEKVNIEVNTYQSEAENITEKDLNVRSIIESINSRQEIPKVRSVGGRHATRGAAHADKDTDSDSSFDKKKVIQTKRKSPIKGDTESISLFELEVVRKFDKKEAKSVAMTELNFRGNNNFKYKEEDFPALGQRNNRNRFSMEIEKWEDRPCPIRANDWFTPNRRQSRGYDGKGRTIPESSKVSNNQNNRFYPLETEDTQILPTSQYDYDMEERKESYSHKQRNHKPYKTNFGIQNDNDIEELIKWIKEQNLTNIIKNKLKEPSPGTIRDHKYIQGSKGEPTEVELDQIYEDKQRYYLKNYQKEKHNFQQDREISKLPITYKEERYQSTKSTRKEPPIIIKNKDFYHQNKPTTSKHRTTPTREDNLNIPEFRSKSKHNYSTLPKTSPRPTQPEEKEAPSINPQSGYMSNEEWEGTPHIEELTSQKKSEEKIESTEQQKSPAESVQEEMDFTFQKVIPDTQDKEEDNYSESFKSPQTETDDDLDFVNSQPENK